MFCPQCGAQADKTIKYCKQCGMQLNRVRGVMARGGAGYKTAQDAAEGQPSEEQRERRGHRRKKTPEEKRIDEIKAGVITTSVGAGITIFFSLLFEAIANATGDKPGADILRSLWAVGLVPVFIGLGLLINGLFISKRLVALQQAEAQAQPASVPVLDTAPVAQLPPADAQAVADFSVTEHTTAKLGKVAVPASREIN
jgi:hypothetical protein